MGRNDTNGLCSNLAAEKIGNIYDMVLIASKRTRELSRGEPRLCASTNSNPVTALIEIENGLIGREYLTKIIKEKRR